MLAHLLGDMLASINEANSGDVLCDELSDGEVDEVQN